MPSGAARRYWLQRLSIDALPGPQQDFQLLRQGCIAPVGNLRIKESLPELPLHSRLPQLRFKIADVVERDTNFLEYAQQMGAVSRGATALTDIVEPEQLLNELGTLARQLGGLCERLRQRGVSERLLTMPALGLEYLDNKLAHWGLP